MKSLYLSRWVDQYLTEHPVRANSLIITIYGDFVAPHGGTIWLGSIIKLAQLLGVNERYVRTSVYRLSQEKWLASERIGRKSYYRLTLSGRRRFEQAFRRIYYPLKNTWSGEWQLVILPSSLAASERDALRKELLWAGYGAIASGVLAHPSADTEALLTVLQDNGTEDRVVAMTAASIDTLDSRPLQELVRECWNLDSIRATYGEFVDRLKPVLRALRNASELDPEQCFTLQTIVMHDFRRALLQDPLLPSQLLPPDWSGSTAREICRDIYRLTFRQAQRHILQIGETPDGPLPAAAPYFYERFGGLVDIPPGLEGIAI
ncbi:MAG: phenylacetic acid degradation operon negative regulatory protein PaaX [Desulfobulbus sp.]|nr:phenylacetic acid degradation operon negative regulatory protein PaaX [Desulfobulbus sp.]